MKIDLDSNFDRDRFVSFLFRRFESPCVNRAHRFSIQSTAKWLEDANILWDTVTVNN